MTPGPSSSSASAMTEQMLQSFIEVLRRCAQEDNLPLVFERFHLGHAHPENDAFQFYIHWPKGTDNIEGFFIFADGQITTAPSNPGIDPYDFTSIGKES